MKRLLALLAAVACSSLPATAQTTWEMPTPYADSEFHTKNIRMFAEDVEKSTGGKIKINVHSGGSLYKMPQIKPAVQSGQVPIGEIIISFLANEHPIYDADWLLFAANSYPEAMRLWEASRGAIEERLGTQGVKVLYTVPWPPQALFSKRPVNSVADLKGMKIRAYNKSTARIAEVVGAVPVQIEAAEMTQAFATGVAEALMTSPSSAYNNKLYEFLPYGYDVRASLPKDIVIINKRVFDRLDAPLQKAVTDAAARAQERGWKMSEEETALRVKQLTESGMKFTAPSATLEKEFREIGVKLADEWAKAAGAAGEAMLKKYRGG